MLTPVKMFSSTNRHNRPDFIINAWYTLRLYYSGHKKAGTGGYLNWLIMFGLLSAIYTPPLGEGTNLKTSADQGAGPKITHPTLKLSSKKVSVGLWLRCS